MRYELLYPTVFCYDCDGHGMVEGRGRCERCGGTGEIKHGLDNSPYGFGPEAEVVRWNEVYAGEAEGETPLAVAEEVFHLFNIGDRPVRVRSMSVGDRVRIDDTLFVCDVVGFTEAA